jgi:hypothetical protein
MAKRAVGVTGGNAWQVVQDTRYCDLVLTVASPGLSLTRPLSDKQPTGQHVAPPPCKCCRGSPVRKHKCSCWLPKLQRVLLPARLTFQALPPAHSASAS